MPQDFDVFISYSSADNTWVQNLRTALTVKGIRVWLDKDQIRPGDLFVDALETGISSAKCVALVVSPNSTHSGWVKEEYHRALVLHEQVRLIPILLRDAELPGFLTSRKWIDFRDPGLFDQSLDELCWGITGDHAAQNFEPLPERSRIVRARRWLAPVIAAAGLTLLTGIVFSEWAGNSRASFGAVEYLVVFVFWALIAFCINWLWRFLRSRRSPPAESHKQS